MSDEQALVNVNTALNVLHEALSPPPDLSNVPFSKFLEGFSVPLRLQEVVGDATSQTMGQWLVAGYAVYAEPKGITVSRFCMGVLAALRDELGLDCRLPSTETMRNWYYVGKNVGVSEVQKMHGHGMAAACYLQDDPDGERALRLAGAAVEVSSEIGLGKAAVAIRLKRAYAGHQEQDWAEGLPTLHAAPVETTRWEPGAKDGEDDEVPCRGWALFAVWRDGTADYLGVLLDAKEYKGERREIALQDVFAQLRVKMPGVIDGRGRGGPRYHWPMARPE